MLNKFYVLRLMGPYMLASVQLRLFIACNGWRRSVGLTRNLEVGVRALSHAPLFPWTSNFTIIA